MFDNQIVQQFGPIVAMAFVGTIVVLFLVRKIRQERERERAAPTRLPPCQN